MKPPWWTRWRTAASPAPASPSSRWNRCRDGELDEAPHLLDFFFLDVIARIETFDFAGDSAGKSRRVKRRDPRDAALGSKNRTPGQFRSNPQRRQQSDAGHYDSS